MIVTNTGGLHGIPLIAASAGRNLVAGITSAAAIRRGEAPIDASYGGAQKKGATYTDNANVQLLVHACTVCLNVDVRNIVD